MCLYLEMFKGNAEWGSLNYELGQGRVNVSSTSYMKAQDKETPFGSSPVLFYIRHHLILNLHI